MRKHSIDKHSDEKLQPFLYKKKRPIRFFPWQSDDELCREFEQSHLCIKAFYKTVYLPKVPEGVKPMAYSSFSTHIHLTQNSGEVETLPSPEAVQCFDLTDKVSVIDCAPSEIDQVRITLANGTSIAFYPGSASEVFVMALLRQNGVRI